MTPSANDVPLYRAAHGRAGDKGDRSNISIIAWDPELFETLVQEVTEVRIRDVFATRSPTQVRRYLLPNLCAMNIVLDNALDGGVNRSMNLDSHGKSLSFLLLDMRINVPGKLLSLLRGNQ